jgi:hypothetical protein
LPPGGVSNIPFQANLTDARASDGQSITGSRNVVVTSNRVAGSGIVFNGPVSFLLGEAQYNITLTETAVDSLEHTLAFTVEDVSQPVLASIKIGDNTAFTVKFRDDLDTRTVEAGDLFRLFITNATAANSSSLLQGFYQVKVESNLQPESLVIPVQFDMGEATVPVNASGNITVFTSGLHTLSVTIIETGKTVYRPGLTVTPKPASNFLVTRQPAAITSGSFNYADTYIGPVEVVTADVFGNPVPVSANISAQLVPVNPVVTSAQLKGSGVHPAWISVNTTETIARFDNLTLNRNGQFRLRFIHLSGTLDEVLSDVFTMENLEDIADFTLVHPGPQVVNVEFEVGVTNARNYQGILLDGNYVVGSS